MVVQRADVPVVLPDQDWEKGALLSAVSVIPDADARSLILFYMTRFPDNPEGNVLCLARSEDGCTWSKPDCGDGTNIVMRGAGNPMHWGQFMPTRILLDVHEENPSHRWKMIYWDRPDPDWYPGICLATSPDGLRWTPLFSRPVITNVNDAMSMVDTRPDLSSSTQPGPFFIYQQTWKYNPNLPRDRDNLKGMHRRISIWRCASFGVGWVGPITVLEPDEQDPTDVQFYWLTPYHTEHGYGGLLHCHHTTDQTMDVQLVTSSDGWSWHRDNDRKPVLSLGGAGRFDCGALSAMAAPVLWQDKVLLLYNGRARVHDGQLRYPEAPEPVPASGIGLAVFDDGLLFQES